MGSGPIRSIPDRFGLVPVRPAGAGFSLFFAIIALLRAGSGLV